ncbi:PREDICTED: protein neuralized isoform X2 [Nicrophorus vespilloides]|uniref:Protein neuralized isoform X2 n=1 Tax=Nicrophorus vespilloides TaxID=110193 RepID=A0ABM1N2L2_NICVS|nr:PREDICTED: protein neuralized isoform X2 [Nicrophorus vespilloides]
MWSCLVMGQRTSGMPASRSSSNGGCTNNLPPLLFHNVHGDNIRISRDGTVAKRAESFCKGIAFSARPVKVNEKICVKFVEVSNNWSGVIRFGFTYNNPSTLQHNLPKYACPDLTNKPGNWAKALPEHYANQNTVLFYYVTSAGDVHFGINGEEKGIFFSGVETRGQLWALIDVYGNSTGIEFVDIRHQLNNSRRNTVDNTTPDEIDRIVYPMQNVSIHNEELNLPVLRYQPAHLNYNPVALHRTRGSNIRFNSNRSVASRVDAEFCQGYVFTGRPVQLGEKMVIQILSTEPVFQGCLGLGLTSCDPATLQACDLPDDSNFLLDRPEYWVISRDFARNLNVGDEISFCISANGEVQISKNGGPPAVVIHVDQTLKLWAFFDVYGSTRRIRVLSYTAPTTPTRNPLRIMTPSNSESMNSLNSQSELRRNSVHPQVSSRCCLAPADIQLQPSANGGTVLSVILPPSHANLINQQNSSVPVSHHTSQISVNSQSSHPSQHVSYPGNHILAPSTTHAQLQLTNPAQPASSNATTGTMMSTCSNTYIEPISTAETPDYMSEQAWVDLNNAALGAGAECTICYEKQIDAVLYMCGHMCMCYECAFQQWRGKGGGHCPLCRAVIRDVIRIYKS